MDEHTYRVLLGLNPWIRDASAWPGCAGKYIPTDYIPRSKKINPVEDRVCLLTGPRQAGKSTLIWKTIQEDSKPWMYINCEEQSLKELCSSPALFFQEMEYLASQARGWFFDEIQHLQEAGLFLKGLADLRTRKAIIATGSSSFHLHARTRESLAGRAERHLLLPLSLSEVLPGHVPETVRLMEGKSLWEKLLVWGGYPEVFRSTERESVLARLVEAFVLRDASDIYRIRNPEAFRKLLGLAASMSGNLVNYSNLADPLGVSVNTVSQYLNILEENHIIRLLPPYIGGKRAEITSRPKIFFLDNGLRNFLFGGFQSLHNRSDAGAVMENMVFCELSKYMHPILDGLNFWRSSSGAEVDFVLQKGQKIIAVEVKSSNIKKPKISRSLRSFIQAYRPDQVLVVNQGLTHSTRVDGVDVSFLVPPEFPLVLSG